MSVCIKGYGFVPLVECGIYFTVNVDMEHMDDNPFTLLLSAVGGTVCNFTAFGVFLAGSF